MVVIPKSRVKREKRSYVPVIILSQGFKMSSPAGFCRILEIEIFQLMANARAFLLERFRIQRGSICETSAPSKTVSSLIWVIDRIMLIHNLKNPSKHQIKGI